MTKKQRIVIEVDKDTNDLITEFCNKKRLQPEQLLSYLATAIEASKQEDNCAELTPSRQEEHDFLGHGRGAQSH